MKNVKTKLVSELVSMLFLNKRVAGSPDIRYTMFNKICLFKNRVIRTDVIMRSLFKSNGKYSNLHKTRQIIHHSKGFDNSYPKMYFLLILSHSVKSYGHLRQFLVCFTMTTHQIWSSDVTQNANFEIFNCSLILH